MHLLYGGIRFEDWPSSLDGSSFLIGPAGIKWLGGLTFHREEVPRSSGHGAFDLPATLPQKVVPVSGELLAAHPAQLEHMKRQLTGLAEDGRPRRAVFKDAFGESWRDMSVAVQADFGTGDATSCPFELSFWAADPRAYGESRSFAPGEMLANYGSSKAWPKVTVSGAGTAYSVSSQGRSFSVSSALPAGSTDVIDMSTGRVLRNGSLLVGGVSAPRVWGVPAGGSVAWSVSGASASVLVTDTFI